MNPYRMLLSVVVIVVPAMAVRAGGDSIFHRVEAEVMTGAVLHTNEFLKGDNPELRTMNHALSVQLKYAFMKSSESHSGIIYKGAYQGVGVAWNEFNPLLGNPLSAFLYQGATIASISPRLALNYEWKLGMAFGWNHYDPVTNLDNKVVGSKVTALLSAGTYLNWRMNRYMDVNMGITLSHYSNGNTQLPNNGLNTASLKAGVVYYVNREGVEERPLSTPGGEREGVEEVSPKWKRLHTDLVAFGAWKRMAYLGVDGVETVPASFGVAGLNINPMYEVNNKLNAGLSLDFLYDHSANITYDQFENVIGYPGTWQQMAVGLSGRAEFVMPYFTINLGIGHNVIHAKGHLSGWYEVLALKIKLVRWAFVHIGYSLSDFESPNHLMLGLGMRLNHRKK